ncbi:MAG: hypothetical protein IKJ58_00640 [Akkermansia sp.]|nr:hypothetical protein [Akkermansia sp.]
MRNPHPYSQPGRFQATSTENTALSIYEQLILKQLLAAGGHSSLRQLSSGLKLNFNQTRHLLTQLQQQGLVLVRASELDDATLIYSLTTVGTRTAAPL